MRPSHPALAALLAFVLLTFGIGTAVLVAGQRDRQDTPPTADKDAERHEAEEEHGDAEGLDEIPRSQVMPLALAYGQDRYVAPYPTGQAGSGAEAVSHYGGGRAMDPQPPRQERPDTRLYRTGSTAIEPTLGLDRNGSIFYTATVRRNNFLPEVLRSADGGRSWEIVSPRMAGQISTPPPWTPTPLWIGAPAACSPSTSSAAT